MWLRATRRLREYKNETIPKHQFKWCLHNGGAQRLRVANAQAEVQVPHETHIWTTIFTNSESYLAVNRI